MDKRYLKEHIETFECYLENHFLDGHRSFDYIKEYIEEQNKEIEKLNNIINEIKEWIKGYYKSYASCKWYEEDYIEFIEHLENELKGVDK